MPLRRRVVRRTRRVVATARVWRPAPLAALALVRAGLVDRDWYSLQARRTFGHDLEAAAHFVLRGRARGLSPHPLFEPEWVDARGGRTGRRDPLRVYTSGRSDRGGPSPLFSDAVWVGAHPDAIRHAGGPLGHWLAAATSSTLLPVPDGCPPEPWGAVRDRLTDAVRRDREPGPPPEPARVSPLDHGAAGPDPDVLTVTVPVREDWLTALRTLEAVLDPAQLDPAWAGPDRGPGRLTVEVVLALESPRPAVARLLTARVGADPRVQLRRAVGDQGWASQSGPAVAGATAVLLSPGAVPPSGTLAALVAALEGGAAVAGTPDLRPDGTLLAAGWGVDDDGTPVPLLDGHPREDVAGAGPLPVPAVAGDAFALRATDLRSSGGLDPGLHDSRAALIDLSLRLSTAGRPAAVVAVPTTASLTGGGPLDPRDLPVLAARWRGRIAGRAVLEAGVWHRRGLAPVGRAAGTAPRVEVVREAAPGLRWAVKIGAPWGPRGDAWGDVYFARDLAAALERLGQYAAVDRREAHHRPSAHLDDVVLNVRGLDRVQPDPAQVNLLWVISHPDLVGEDELRSWDVVFAASSVWAARTSARTGLPVHPLLQATDAGRFVPGDVPRGTGDPVLFIGNSRGVVRPIVRDAVRAGLDLAVYGDRWEQFVPAGYVRGHHVPNDRLAAAYRSAGVVLNDHWPDMAREGFISNRLFDAVASGARVVTDRVPGVEEVFGSAVRVYDTVADLRRLAGPGNGALWPSDDELLAVASQVRREHSFDARARTLLDAALRVRAARA